MPEKMGFSMHFKVLIVGLCEEQVSLEYRLKSELVTSLMLGGLGGRVLAKGRMCENIRFLFHLGGFREQRNFQLGPSLKNTLIISFPRY